ncbi:MAG: helix-turn-helix transcriptional regulator [Clostridiales bacterium]|nr:helix-turn-helix transcriptional regulator [Clostridiales bacterium]
MRDYGRVHIKLKEVMAQKQITRNRLCVLTGIKFDTVQKYYLGCVYRIDVDVLAKFCYALDCQIHDIIEYKP